MYIHYIVLFPSKRVLLLYMTMNVYNIHNITCTCTNTSPFRRSTCPLLWVLSSLSKMVEKGVLSPTGCVRGEQPYPLQVYDRLKDVAA